MEERVLRRLMTGMFAGLQSFHARGVLHRDIKPENAVLGVDGNMKLCDFGGIKCIDPQDSSRSHTLSCNEVGSYLYLPPETICGAYDRRRYGKGSELWSMGVFCLVLRTRKNPSFVSGLPDDPSQCSAAGTVLAQQIAAGRSPAEALDGHMADGCYGALSESLRSLLCLLLSDRGTRRGLDITADILQHPWFAEPAASDLEFAQWVFQRKPEAQRPGFWVRTLQKAPARALLQEGNAFYASLVGLTMARQNAPPADLLRYLGLGAFQEGLSRLGLGLLSDLTNLEEEDCDNVKMTRQHKQHLASAMLAAFGEQRLAAQQALQLRTFATEEERDAEAAAIERETTAPQWCEGILMAPLARAGLDILAAALSPPPVL